MRCLVRSEMVDRLKENRSVVSSSKRFVLLQCGGKHCSRRCGRTTNPLCCRTCRCRQLHKRCYTESNLDLKTGTIARMLASKLHACRFYWSNRGKRWSHGDRNHTIKCHYCTHLWPVCCVCARHETNNVYHMKTRERKKIHFTRARTPKESVCVAMRAAIVCGIQWRRQLNGNKIYSRVRLRLAFCCLSLSVDCISSLLSLFRIYVLALLDDASSTFKILFSHFSVVVVIEGNMNSGRRFTRFWLSSTQVCVWVWAFNCSIIVV